MRTLLWALDEFRGAQKGDDIRIRKHRWLLDRRDRLEKTGFRNGSGDRLKLADLYEEFFRLSDEYVFDVYKIRGHTRKSERSDIERLFSFLDQRVRKELRKSAK